MKDASVLLNLTGKVVFERTDPLLDLVSGYGPFLYYDLLSLERFPLVRKEQEEHAQKLLISLRNLLESRRLSEEDSGGNIRIIVIFDLVGGFSHQEGISLCFPAQKARRFKEMVSSVFEKDPQLLCRFRFYFIFIESKDEDHADFYRQLAYDGYSGFHDRWLSSAMTSINHQRDQLIAKLQSPLEETSLNDNSIREPYSNFLQSLEKYTTDLSRFLGQAGLEQPFRQAVDKKCRGFNTVGELASFDFDELYQSAVSELIGLCSPLFKGCSSFIFKLRTGTVIHRKTDEVVLESLLQLLATTSTPWPHRFSVIDASVNDASLNVDAILKLKQAVSSCLPRMRKDGVLRWSEDKLFQYMECTRKNTSPTESDTFSKVNEQIAKKRNWLYDQFCALRKVPFFFGRETGDWGWYMRVTDLLETIYAFEYENDRPLYDSQRRITDKEMNRTPHEASYAELKVKRDKLSEGKTPSYPMENLKAYLKQRMEVMDEFSTHKEQLKTEMVRLGFAVTTFWLSLLATLVLTLSFAFHFFTNDNDATPLWTGIAFACLALTSVFAALIGQSVVKKPIAASFSRIDECLDRLRKGQEEYIKRVNNRIIQQNAADIRRKNLQEIEEKIARFDRHSLQVDLWQKHFAGMEVKLSEMLNYCRQAASGSVDTITINDHDLNVEEIPHLPEAVCKDFQSMQTILSSGQQIVHVTCFLSRLDVTSIDS